MSNSDKLFMLKSQPTTNQLRANPMHVNELSILLKISLPKLKFIAPNKATKLRNVTQVIETERYTEAMLKYSKNTSTESIRSISRGARQWQKKTICISCIYLSKL
jgi:hypothetical protein